MPARPEYGFDAPGVFRNLLLVGLAAVLLGRWVDAVHIGTVTLRLTPMLFSIGSVFLLQALLMALYVRFGKFVHRERMLNSVAWKGNEHVLDVGTGRGLLLIGAAKKLCDGQATGIDIWSKQDMAGNSMQATYRNAELEGVRGKIDLLSDDARHMSFPKDSFNVVLSNLCLHNIPDAAGREAACREIARVLRPGGVALISDFKNTRDYQKAFEAAGLRTARSRPAIWYTFPPGRIVRAEKP